MTKYMAAKRLSVRAFRYVKQIILRKKFKELYKKFRKGVDYHNYKIIAKKACTNIIYGHRRLMRLRYGNYLRPERMMGLVRKTLQPLARTTHKFLYDRAVANVIIPCLRDMKWRYDYK